MANLEKIKQSIIKTSWERSRSETSEHIRMARLELSQGLSYADEIQSDTAGLKCLEVAARKVDKILELAQRSCEEGR
jgi:hypothetical protein